MFLKSDDIYLRALCIDDANNEYLSWLNNSDVTSGLVSGTFPSTLQELVKYVSAKTEDRNTIIFAICDTKTNKHIGNIKIDNFDWVSRTCELGILIGNSAEYTNNHIDGLEKLKTINLLNHNLIIPLSYGDKSNADLVEKYTIKYFPHNSIILTDFMSLESYTALISTCEIAIMPHIRQQALGNIVKLLIGGAKIFFNKKSSIYIYLKEQKFHVFKLSEMINLNKLSKEEKQINRELSLEFFGAKNIHTKIKNLISSLN